jgi:hypothetical protein
VDISINNKEKKKCSEDSIFYESRRKPTVHCAKQHHLGKVDYQAWVPLPGIMERMSGLLISEGTRKALYKDSGLERWYSGW